MAGAVGIEPTSAVLETAVLPLNDAPLYVYIRSRIGYQIILRNSIFRYNRLIFYNRNWVAGVASFTFQRFLPLSASCVSYTTCPFDVAQGRWPDLLKIYYFPLIFTSFWVVCFRHQRQYFVTSSFRSTVFLFLFV